MNTSEEIIEKLSKDRGISAENFSSTSDVSKGTIIAILRVSETDIEKEIGGRLGDIDRTDLKLKVIISVDCNLSKDKTMFTIIEHYTDLKFHSWKDITANSNC